ncbi:hypothetical protein ACLOJK_020454 [Asimina triloba]
MNNKEKEEKSSSAFDAFKLDDPYAFLHITRNLDAPNKVFHHPRKESIMGANSKNPSLAGRSFSQQQHWTTSAIRQRLTRRLVAMSTTFDPIEKTTVAITAQQIEQQSAMIDGVFFLKRQTIGSHRQSTTISFSKPMKKEEGFQRLDSQVAINSSVRSVLLPLFPFFFSRMRDEPCLSFSSSALPECRSARHSATAASPPHPLLPPHQIRRPNLPPFREMGAPSIPSRNGSHLGKFRLEINHAVPGPSLHRWLRYAAKHSVQQLELRFYCKGQLYRLPRQLFCFKSLTDLILVLLDCSIRLPTCVAIPNLESLHSARLETPWSSLPQLLCLCPNLKILNVRQCLLGTARVFDVSVCSCLESFESGMD